MKKIMDMLRSLFVVEATDNKEFKRYTLEKTAKRGTIFAVFILLVEILMISLTFIIPEYFIENLIQLYRIHYYVLAGISLSGIFFFLLFKSGRIKSIVLLEYFLMVNVILCLSWGASVSLLDQVNSSHIAVYLTFMILLAVGALLPPSKMASILVSVEVLFIILLPYYQQNSDFLFSIRLNSSFFLLFAFVIARQFYAEEYLNFKKDILIQEQNNSLTKQNARLMYLNSIDPLTNLYNRQSLDNVLASLWESSDHQDKALHVFMMDVDRFKSFNDNHGHIAGDHCLIMIGQVLNDVAKDYHGYAFRYGGDEFLFLLISDDKDQINKIIDHIYTKIENSPIQTDHTLFYTKISLGHGSGKINSDTNPWDIIHMADQKLYIYKTQK